MSKNSSDGRMKEMRCNLLYVFFVQNNIQAYGNTMNMGYPAQPAKDRYFLNRCNTCFDVKSNSLQWYKYIIGKVKVAFFENHDRSKSDLYMVFPNQITIPQKFQRTQGLNNLPKHFPIRYGIISHFCLGVFAVPAAAHDFVAKRSNFTNVITTSEDVVCTFVHMWSLKSLHL